MRYLILFVLSMSLTACFNKNGIDGPIPSPVVLTPVTTLPDNSDVDGVPSGEEIPDEEEVVEVDSGDVVDGEGELPDLRDLIEEEEDEIPRIDDPVYDPTSPESDNTSDTNFAQGADGDVVVDYANITIPRKMIVLGYASGNGTPRLEVKVGVTTFRYLLDKNAVSGPLANYVMVFVRPSAHSMLVGDNYLATPGDKISIKTTGVVNLLKKIVLKIRAIQSR